MADHFNTTKGAGAIAACLAMLLAVSAPTGGRAADSDIVINEIMYHPDTDCETEEFIEIFNKSLTATVDLSGWQFTDGVTYTFPAGTIMGPGDYVVVCRDIAGFNAYYGPLSITLLGPYNGKLSNNGEPIVLENASGTEIQRVRYNDKRPWPISPDGAGPSLERLSPDDPYTSAGSWRAAIYNNYSAVWTRYEVSGVLTSSTLYFYLDSAGECLIDDIEVRETASPATNYVNNGGFETAAPLQWTATGTHSGSVRVTTDRHTGSACMKIVATGAGGRFSGQVVGSCTGLTFNGPSYTVSFWAKGLKPGVVLRVGLRGGVTMSFSPTQSRNVTDRMVVRGSYTYDGGTDTYRVTGGGSDIDGTTDHFYYVYTTLDGDGALEAVVTKISNNSTENPDQALGGLMIRETTNIRSPFACCSLTWGNGVAFNYRIGGNQSQRIQGPVTGGPIKLRLRRETSTFIAEADPGTGYVEVGQIDITMPQQVLIGFAVLPYDNAQGAPYDRTAVYDFAAPVATIGGDVYTQVNVPGFFATPGGLNSRFTTNLPPYIRNVDTWPDQPTSIDPIAVHAKVTDDDGVGSVMLSYQLVRAGSYIRIGDPTFWTTWTDIAMAPSSTPSVYVATIPAQSHRTLVRYRISAQDGTGEVTTVPYSDDTEPNYARFVYNGVPPYGAWRHPEADDGVRLKTTHNVLTKVPVIQLIANPADVDEAQKVPITDKVERRQFKWRGTLVFNGKVYDHIRFRVRGGTWRYKYQKRMWKFRFNRGHRMDFLRNDGTPYEEEVRTLNLFACIQPPGNVPSWVEAFRGDGSQRGEAGFVDRSCFWLLKQVGAIAAECTWIHLRIVDDASEMGVDPDPSPPDQSQYYGDFFGLYLAGQGMDERMLRMCGRPTGNLYKMDNYGQLPGGPPWFQDAKDCSLPEDDINQFINAYSTNPAPTWWEQNFNLETYYSARAVVDCAHHGDMVGGKNYYYYHNPVTLKWELIPWDFDLTFGTDYGDARMPFRDRLLTRNVGPPFDAAPNGHPEFEYIDIAYRNRLREVIQLLYCPEKFFPVLDQWYEMLHEIAAADMFRWDWAPYTIPGTNPRWDERNTQRGGFEPLDVRLGDIKVYIGDRVQYLTTPRGPWTGQTEWWTVYRKEYGWRDDWWDPTCWDPDIPATPTLTAPAPTTEFSVHRSIRLSSSAFSDPNGSLHFSSKWIATRVGGNELMPDWSSGITHVQLESMTIPPGALAPGDYWLRVRHGDVTDRWSWWSDAVPITVTDQASAVRNWRAY